jgi:hypothetical protein
MNRSRCPNLKSNLEMENLALCTVHCVPDCIEILVQVLRYENKFYYIMILPSRTRSRTLIHFFTLKVREQSGMIILSLYI